MRFKVAYVEIPMGFNKMDLMLVLDFSVRSFFLPKVIFWDVILVCFSKLSILLQHFSRNFIFYPRCSFYSVNFRSRNKHRYLSISSIDKTYIKKRISTEWDRKVFYMHSTQFVFTMGKVEVSAVFMYNIESTRSLVFMCLYVWVKWRENAFSKDHLYKYIQWYNTNTERKLPMAIYLDVSASAALHKV